MEQRKVKTVNDVIFKKVFASPQNSHILMGFINDVLGLDITEVTVENTYNIKTFYDENNEGDTRYTQVDVLARLRDGRLVTIEMQLCKHAWLRERILFYLAEAYASNYAKKSQEDVEAINKKKEWKYSSLRPIYGIYIVLANEFEDEDAIHKFGIYDQKHDLWYKNYKGEEMMTLMFLELGKPLSEEDKRLQEWFAYFRTGKVSEDAPDYVKQACEVADYQGLEKEEVDMVSARERAEQDALAREHYVWTEGIQQGVQQGVEQGKEIGKVQGIETIINQIYAKGKSIQEIGELTGLSTAEIRNLIK